jgi:hypothetical protein
LPSSKVIFVCRIQTNHHMIQSYPFAMKAYPYLTRSRIILAVLFILCVGSSETSFGHITPPPETEAVKEARLHIPDSCYLVQVTVPSGVDPTCTSNSTFDVGCEAPPNCSTCTKIALQLHCDGCWVENITFSFPGGNECFFVCGVIDLPTQSVWVAPANRDRRCSTNPETLTTPNPNQGDWANHGVGVFKFCRTGTGSTNVNYSADVYCPDLFNPLNPPIFHGSITGVAVVP